MPAEILVEAIGPSELNRTDARLIAELLCAVWPKPGRTVESRMQQMLQEHASATAPRSFVVREEGRAIAHALLLPRTIATSTERIMLGGLARVCTHPEHRGRGLGELVVRSAFGVVDAGEFPWSLFQTTQAVRPFYEKLGAELAINRFVNSLGESPEENPFWDEIAMRYPSGGNWPSGTIDLLGPGY